MEPGEIIKKAREKKDWSQKDLADRVGISQPAIKKIEAGDTRQSKFIPKIARVLDIDIAEIDRSLQELATFAETQRSDPVQELPMVSDRPADFPVYASAEGGPGEIIRSTDPVDFVPRPTHLLRVRDAYGLLVTGDSMAPEYRSGEMAIVEPRLPIESGEVYIFYSENNGEARATIKFLRRSSEDKWFLSQHNPAEGQSHDFTLSRKTWIMAHRVTGKYRRRF